MNIADLFIKLGLKGENDTAKGIKKVDDSMKGVVSTGLAVKASLAAMAYGLQHLMSTSSEAGASINQFENSTGLSGKLLQQWQYAARQFNVEAEDMTQSIRSVQDAITNRLRGKGPIEGFGLVAAEVGLDQERVRDTYYVLEKLQEFAKKVPADISKSMLKSFGISEGVIAAMRQNAFRDDIFQQAPIYSDAEVQKLREVNVLWENMYGKIEASIGKMNADHGGDLVKDIGRTVDSVLKLTEALITLSEKLKLFEIVGKSIEGWGTILDEAGTMVDGKTPEGKEIDRGERAKGFLEFLKSDLFSGNYGFDENRKLKELPPNFVEKNVTPDQRHFVEKNVTPDQRQLPSVNEKSQVTNNKTTINQTFNFKDGSNPKEIGDTVKKATKDAYRQSFANGQVN